MRKSKRKTSRIRVCATVCFYWRSLLGGTSLWLVVVAFTGPRDNLDLLARPQKAMPQSCSLSRPSQGHATVAFRWRSHSRPRVDSVRRHSQFCPRDSWICWRSLLKPWVTCGRHRGPFRPRDAVFSSSLLFRAAWQFGLVGAVTVWFIGAAYQGGASTFFVVFRCHGLSEPLDSLAFIGAAFRGGASICSSSHFVSCQNSTHRCVVYCRHGLFGAVRGCRLSPWPPRPCDSLVPMRPFGLCDVLFVAAAFWGRALNFPVSPPLSSHTTIPLSWRGFLGPCDALFPSQWPFRAAH